MSTIRGIGEWAFPMALFYGVRAAMGPRMWEEFFGPYIKLGFMIWDRLPAWNHPILLVVYGAVALMLLSGWIRLGRSIASAVVALFLVRAGFALVGETSVPPPSLWLGGGTILAIGWLMVITSFYDAYFLTWISKYKV